MPINDLREHVESADCWCRPRADEEEPSVLVHNALDRRERYETGETVPDKPLGARLESRISHLEPGQVATVPVAWVQEAIGRLAAQGTPTRQSRDAKQGSVGVADGGPVAESDAPK